MSQLIFIALFSDSETERMHELSGVDALCIDQDNAEEKNHRVFMMGDVYRNSSQVLIWLGEHELDEDRGEFLDDLAPTYRSQIRWDA